MLERLPSLAICTLAASVGCSSSNPMSSMEGDAGIDGDGDVDRDDADVVVELRRVDTSLYFRTSLLKVAPEGPVILNGLNLGPLTVASIDPDELAELNSESLASNGETIGDAARQILAYAYSCALPATSSMQLQLGEDTWEFNGLLGLAPEWETGACDLACQEWVSACMLARTNQFGTEVKLSLRGDHPALATTPAIRSQYTLREGSFYGNIFTGAAEIDGNAYACAGGEGSAKWEMTNRYCSAIGDGCPIITVADCNITNFACDPDVSGCSSFTACSDWNDDALPTTCYSEKHACGQAVAGDSYTRIITAYLEPSARVCGDGFCEENEAETCAADCAGHWVASFGSGCHEDSGGLSVDDAGNIGIIGRFMGNLDMGPTVLSTDGNFDQDLFVASMSPEGTVVWAKSLDSGGYASMIRSVTHDSDGNVIVAGHFANDTDLGDGTVSATDFTLFVAKYAAASGTYMWSKTMPMSTAIFGDQLTLLPNLEVVADGADGVVLAAAFVGSLDLGLGAGNPTSEGNKDDIIIARFDSAGDLDWHSLLVGDLVVAGNVSSEGRAVISGLALDSNDDVVVVGSFSSTLQLGALAPLASDSPTDVDGFVVKLSSVGVHQWAAQISGKNNKQEALDVAVGADDAIVVVGSYIDDTSIAGATVISSTIDVEENRLTNPDAFVANFNKSGDLVWSTNFGSGRTDVAQQVAWNGTDSFVVSSIVTSDLGGTVDVEGTIINAGDIGDIALIRYNTTGDVESVTHHPSPVTEETKGLVASGDQVTISGEFMGTLRFGGTYITNSGGSSAAVVPGDVFVTSIKLAP